MNMDVVEGPDGVTRVTLEGRFDIAGAAAVDLKFSTIAGAAKLLAVDLTKVTFLASMGVRTLMLTAKTIIRRGGAMAVCGADESVDKVLRSTGFDEIVDLYSEMTSAVAGLTSRGA